MGKLAKIQIKPTLSHWRARNTYRKHADDDCFCCVKILKCFFNCLYIYIYTYIHTHTYTHIYIDIYIYIQYTYSNFKLSSDIGITKRISKNLQILGESDEFTHLQFQGLIIEESTPAIFYDKMKFTPKLSSIHTRCHA